MKAIEFSEVNVRIAEHQDEYETIPAYVRKDDGTSLIAVTMCFELNKEERKQVSKTGHIWHTVLTQPKTKFNPIRMDTLKPEL